MRYLLVTNMLSQLMRLQGNVADRVNALPTTDLVVTCTISRGEILFGIAAMPMGRKRQLFAKQAEDLFNRIMTGGASHF